MHWLNLHCLEDSILQKRFDISSTTGLGTNRVHLRERIGSDIKEKAFSRRTKCINRTVLQSGMGERGGLVVKHRTLNGENLLNDPHIKQLDPVNNKQHRCNRIVQIQLYNINYFCSIDVRLFCITK